MYDMTAAIHHNRSRAWTYYGLPKNSTTGTHRTSTQQQEEEDGLLFMLKMSVERNRTRLVSKGQEGNRTTACEPRGAYNSNIGVKRTLTSQHHAVQPELASEGEGQAEAREGQEPRVRKHGL